MRNCSIVILVSLACGGPRIVDDGGAADSTTMVEGSDETFEPETVTITSATSGGSQDGADTVDVSTAGESDEADEGGDEHTGFIVNPDGGSSTIECDLWVDNCPAGFKCMPWANDGGTSWNATKCSPLAEDPNEPGEPCTVEGNGVSGIDDCEARAMCWNVDPDTNMGECVAMCSGSESEPTCEGPCEICPITSEGVLILCLPAYDALAQDCGEGQGCYPWHDGTTLCIPDASGDGGGLGEPCEFMNACDPGLFCAPAETLSACEGVYGCCTPFCDASLADPCAGMGDGIECVPLEDGGEVSCASGLVGGCLLPE